MFFRFFDILIFNLLIYLRPLTVETKKCIIILHGGVALMSVVGGFRETIKHY